MLTLAHDNILNLLDGLYCLAQRRTSHHLLRCAWIKIILVYSTCIAKSRCRCLNSKKHRKDHELTFEKPVKKKHLNVHFKRQRFKRKKETDEVSAVFLDPVDLEFSPIWGPGTIRNLGVLVGGWPTFCCALSAIKPGNLTYMPNVLNRIASLKGWICKDKNKTFVLITDLQKSAWNWTLRVRK